ncbi:phosphodiesterase [Christensenellaceae bacterium OttesenSCG-928-K19]|nr:phosphodiesterase [Christensenellaceae bacterium OttesenSCG-928-K19]
MKLMIASDLHGSLLYAEKMASLYKREGAGRLILLGDLLYHGPRNDLPEGYDPKGVFTLLNSMKDCLLCVRGNCDADVDQMVLEFPITAESMILYLDGRMVFATHGDKFNNDTPLLIGKNDILLHGHTHVSAIQDTGSYVYLNPGSIALPKDGHHSYMVYEDGTFTIKDISGEALKEWDLS